MSDYLRPYMLYSRQGGSEEQAALAFAHSAREARALAWSGGCSWDITSEYTDLAARLLPDVPWIYGEAEPEKFAQGVPHIIDSPTTCLRCERWGQGKIGADGLCGYCRAIESRERE